MRDTVQLRRRMQTLALGFASIATAGCDGGSARPERVVERHPEAKAKPTAKPDPAAKVEKASSVTTQPRSRFDPIPGDPPYVDGYNPEEATCPSGNWCGTAASVAKVAVPNVPEEMGCSSRISGSIPKGELSGAKFEGLSKSKAMQGSINQNRTERERAKGREGVCCYHWFEYCSGRPLLDGDEPVVAEAREGDDWSIAELGPAVDPDTLDPILRAKLADLWLEDALMEHASIASFARASLELMAVGAPPDLLDACQRAALDEIDHARRCFTLASAYAGRPLAPGPLPAAEPRVPSLLRLACDTFVEGCVGETIAALVATRARRNCIDASVSATLEKIVEDESRHAAHAWATVAWAVRTGGEEVAQALGRLASDLRVTEGSSARDWDDPLAYQGRLSEAALARAQSDAWREIVDPMLESLNGGTQLGVIREG